MLPTNFGGGRATAAQSVAASVGGGSAASGGGLGDGGTGCAETGGDGLLVEAVCGQAVSTVWTEEWGSWTS